MKKWFIAVLVVFLYSNLHAQYTKSIVDFITKKELIVSKGSTTDEVKKKLGKPNNVIPGFIDQESGITLVQPDDFIGQLNYVTWVYSLPIANLDFKIKDKYLLNNKPVTEDLYEIYQNEDSIYIGDKGVVDKLVGEDYIKLKLNNVKKVKKYKSGCVFIKGETRKIEFFPYIYVTFEKSTLMVAKISVFLHSYELKK